MKDFNAITKHKLKNSNINSTIYKFLEQTPNEYVHTEIV